MEVSAFSFPHRNVELVAAVVVCCASQSFLITLSPLNLPRPKTAQGCTWLAWFEVLTFFSKSKGRICAHRFGMRSLKLKL